MNCEKKVSVLMGIYNCQDTLSKAIESILTQSYPNWELILLDDGSQDSTYQIADEYRKKYSDRIVLLKHETNQGLNVTLNHCFQASKGELIARQDGDDVSLPERFEKQVEYLENHPACAFVSCGMYISNGETRVGVRIENRVRPTKKDVFISNQFHHATIMIRREALEAVGAYSEDRRLLRVEDYNLYTKLYAAGFYGENMQDIYYEVLENDDTYHRRKFRYRLNRAYAAFLAADMLGLPKWYKIFAVRGVLVGLLPGFLYKYLHTIKKMAKSKAQQR